MAGYWWPEFAEEELEGLVGKVGVAARPLALERAIGIVRAAARGDGTKRVGGRDAVRWEAAERRSPVAATGTRPSIVARG